MTRPYWQIFKISLQDEFVYKTNFLMWRIRNTLQILIAYFLWTSVFDDPQKIIFGYDRSLIISYVFGVILIRSLVFSSKSFDVPNEISQGSFTNYLLKPIRYFKYWFTRDLASKFLNFTFSVGEFLLLYIIFKPNLFIQKNLEYILCFVIFLVLANYLIFVIRFLVTSITFWVPEMSWGGQFLFMVIITEFLSGAIFPLDIFPHIWQKIFYLTPFPYLIFFPLQVYLGKLPYNDIFFGVSVTIFWSVMLTIVLKKVWNKGVKIYGSEGR